MKIFTALLRQTDRPDRGCRKEAAYRKKQKRPGCTGYETLYKRWDYWAWRTLERDLEVLLKLMKENVETYMPGFTHLQKAQPITFAHHMGAYFLEMFKRDVSRMKETFIREWITVRWEPEHLPETNLSAWQRAIQQSFGFCRPTLNSMDSVSDRDYLIELLSAMSTVMMHLSRFSWGSDYLEFQRISVCGYWWRLQYRKQYHADRRRTRILQSLSVVRQEEFTEHDTSSDNNEGNSRCL